MKEYPIVKMPAILPLLTLLLVSQDEIAQLTMSTTKDSQIGITWKDFALVKKSYFEAFYVHVTVNFLSYNGLQLSYTVNNQRVFFKVNADSSISTTLKQEDAATFIIIGNQKTDSGLHKFNLAYFINFQLKDVHMEYRSDGTARVLLKSLSKGPDAPNSLVTCISVCQT